MLLAAITHRSVLPYRFALDDRTVRIRLKAGRGDLTGCTILYGDKFAWHRRSKTYMGIVASDGLHDYWQADVIPEDSRLCYAFLLEAGERQVWYTEKGFSERLEEGDHPFHYFEFPFLHPAERIAPPDWVYGAVIYQVFPDRFSNGDMTNDPPGVVPWHSEPTFWNVFGGDLQGIIDNLDHIKTVGANVLYLTPIFESPSNHKYDTTDYYRLDPSFGTKELLKELVDRAHSQGIRVVLDAVFNHSGARFAQFKDAIALGPQSPYYEWFHFKEGNTRSAGSLNYAAFGFEAHMPKLNTSHPDVRSYLIDAAVYWTKETGVDGWRLDVANEIDHHFWRMFRERLKEVRPDVWIIGEVWHDALPWLAGDQFDSVMNYPLRSLAIDFFIRKDIKAAAFVEELQRLLMQYPDAVNANLFNMLGSHDTARLLTECNGNKSLLYGLLLFQFTFPGVPSIYYGDEIGMSGGGDPDCRRTMIWDQSQWEHETFAYFRKLASLRKQEKALHSADIRFIETERDDMVIYARHGQGRSLLIAWNGSDLQQEAIVPLCAFDVADQAGVYRDMLSGREVHAGSSSIRLILPPRKAVILPLEASII